MDIFVLALSRFVPLAFLISATLVGSRYVHDIVLRTRPRLARLAFAAVALLGVIAAAPFAMRAACIVGARWAAHRGRWMTADKLLTRYDDWNGRRSDENLRQWAYVRMNANAWRGAEAVLELADHPSPQAQILIGLCQYYEHNPAAEATLARVPDMTATQLCLRDYLLGRIAQHRGDVRGAFELYGKSAQWEPHFYPSVYHGVRLALAAHNPRLASAILDQFVARFPATATAPDVRILRDAIASDAVPDDKEFVIVSD